eukprot:TRINITY_DN13929_c0_g1_i2.p1 TRINITY_DN13929_c0_g1~~TRINITY_DN13929_c0_g1_i2.p1  ORF type:complete len:175 (-),score=29.21 TRINITY_DN13929_c0_g1_i2:566-1090(-)
MEAAETPSGEDAAPAAAAASSSGAAASSSSTAPAASASPSSTNPRKELSYASGAHALFFGGTAAGDRLKTHSSLVGRLQHALNYDFPLAQHECAEWADGLRRVATAPMFPKAPAVACPPAALVLPASPKSGTRRKRPVTDLQQGALSRSASAGFLRRQTSSSSSSSITPGPQLF